MRYLSVCSGIEAATVAWHPLGWKAVAYSEVEPFPCSLLKHHYPEIPNWGDMTRWRDWPSETVDILAGGTPCQSFSVAGQRAGMDDPRGQLALGFCGIAAKYRPRWIVWENVPGVLSSGRGRDFGSFVQSLVDCGYGCAWRVLDAQHFGVAQRRKRLFLVANSTNWRNSCAVLFDRKSLQGNAAASGVQGQGIEPDGDDGAEVCCRGCGVIWEPEAAMEPCPCCGEFQPYVPRLANALQTTANDYSRADGFCIIVENWKIYIVNIPHLWIVMCSNPPKT